MKQMTCSSRVTARQQRESRGTVLVLVVVLLVLLAIICTAYLLRAQQGHPAAQQHSFTTQVQMFVSDLEKYPQQVLMTDIYGSTNNVWTTRWNGVGDWPGNINDASYHAGNWWLADRVPVVPHEAQSADANNRPYWRFITGPPVNPQYVAWAGYGFEPNSAPVMADKQFHSPFWPANAPVT